MRHKSATPLERNEALSQQHSRRLSKLSLGRSSIDMHWLVSTPPPINHLYLSLRYLSWIKVEKNVVLLTRPSEIYNWTNLAKDFQFDLFDSPQPLNNWNCQVRPSFSQTGRNSRCLVAPTTGTKAPNILPPGGNTLVRRLKKNLAIGKIVTSPSWQVWGTRTPLSLWNTRNFFPASKIKPPKSRFATEDSGKV